MEKTTSLQNKVISVQCPFIPSVTGSEVESIDTLVTALDRGVFQDETFAIVVPVVFLWISDAFLVSCLSR